MAQAASAALLQGVPAMAPALRETYALSLPQVGLVLGAVMVGLTLTLLPWGLAADRFGERAVVPAGLAACGVALAITATASSSTALAIGFAVAGMGSASANAASGRVVMGWFGPEERGLALGIRQASVPAGGALGAGLLPLLAARHDAGYALRGLGAAMLAGAVVAVLWLRDSPAAAGAVSPRATLRWALRDGPLWRVSVASALLVGVQVVFIGFVVLFLHDVHGLGAGSAALWLVGVQLASAFVRIGLGRVSDRQGRRISIMIATATCTVALLAALVVVLAAPMPVLGPVLALTGVAAMSWNGLAYVAIAELAPRGSAGAALGFQNTLLALTGALMLPAFGALVAATSWRASFAVLIVLPVAAAALLRAPAAYEARTERPA